MLKTLAMRFQLPVAIGVASTTYTVSSKSSDTSSTSANIRVAESFYDAIIPLRIDVMSNGF